MSHFVIFPPSCTNNKYEIDWFPNSPCPTGRNLPNGSIIVTPEDKPDLLYKFTPWAHTTLARNEIEIYSFLKHYWNIPNLVRMEGISGTEDHLVRIMERSSIGSLEDFLRRSRRNNELIPTDKARFLLAQIAGTMAILHEANIVHRDLKAENILMFGQENDINTIGAKVSDLDRAILLPKNTVLTEPVGSLFHMAPELLSGADYDHHVDLYAFGILMFEVLHPGTRPYNNVATGMPDSLTRSEFAEKVIHESYRPLWRHPDEDLRKLAEQCWATNPDTRPEFEEICARLTVPMALSLTDIGRKDRPRSIKKDKRVGMACTIGEVRQTMEDAISLLETSDRLICGVFDGLRGSKTSELAAWRLPLALASALEGDYSDCDALLRDEFERTQTTLMRAQNQEESGSTATLALLDDNEIKIAWLGDSPAWIFRKAEGNETLTSIALINPHHPERKDEAARLTQNGAQIRREEHMLDNGEMAAWGPVRVFAPDGQKGGIALSRALGLSSLSSIISHEPEIACLKRQENDLFLIVSSDGIFEVMTPSQISDIISNASSAQQAADGIIRNVLQNGAPDNASIIVIDLRE
ncbi:bifunctional serine/threonine-protein kinase/phosphatase [Acetobacteraceae bacterium ESL0709]|nr:bifunctional serine/threonine-protein kinase/phosphatase [Acetobacteraceae bacterium ESL0697]MDF7677870.1 bifunctional serine/threonine-protein kinase/phosphatase [Acetobacteraceae bacterium ESL0709]